MPTRRKHYHPRERRDYEKKKSFQTLDINLFNFYQILKTELKYHL